MGNILTSALVIVMVLASIIIYRNYITAIVADDSLNTVNAI